jgi:hypothetical protein
VNDGLIKREERSWSCTYLNDHSKGSEHSNTAVLDLSLTSPPVKDPSRLSGEVQGIINQSDELSGISPKVKPVGESEGIEADVSNLRSCAFVRSGKIV